MPDILQLEESILLDHFGSLVDMDMTPIIMLVSKQRIEKNLTYIKGSLNDLWKYSNNNLTINMVTTLNICKCKFLSILQFHPIW